ncbi:MAG: flagellar basal body-associated protein FliL [Pseudomonadota bacterium]|uniref:Flagellar protein FliL n=1 Tax=Polaromonas aquatica TaxID=332657 RepID=A0ABW1TXK4_9BURK
MATSTPPVKTPKTRTFSVLLIVLLALGVTATAAAAAYYLGSNHSDSPAVVKPEEPIFVALEPLTVNLLPNGRSRFLHVGVTLKIADAKSQGQIAQYLPEVRSRVLTVLSNREGDTLVTPEDKGKLASDIMAALNQPLTPSQPAQKISSVMFTTFMLQ